MYVIVITIRYHHYEYNNILFSGFDKVVYKLCLYTI